MPCGWWPPRGRRMLVLAFLLVSLMVVVAISGCSIKAGVDTKVNPDGSGIVSVRFAADKALQDAVGSQISGLGIKGGLLDGIIGQFTGTWKVSSGTNSDGTKWVAATHGFKDPAEYNQLITSNSVLSSIFSTKGFALAQSKSWFRTRTTFRSAADVGKAVEGAGKSTGLQIPANLLANLLQFQAENRLTLPGTIKANNADKVDGDTLTWKLKPSGATTMEAESVIYDWGALLIAILAGAVVVAAVVVVVTLLILRRRRKRSAPEDLTGRATAVAENGAPPQAAVPTEQGPVTVDVIATEPPEEIPILPPAEVPSLPPAEPPALTPAEQPALGEGPDESGSKG
jgi:hypothetical protein